MKKEDLDALAGLYEGVYSSVDGEQLNEIAVNFGGQAAVDKVRSQMAAQNQFNARLAAMRAQRFGGVNPVVKAAKGGVQGTLDKTTGKFTPSTTKPAAPTPKATIPAAPTPARPATPGSGAKVAPSSAPKPAPTAAAKPTTPAPGTKAAGPESIKPKTPNPLMQRTFGYQTGNAPDQIKAASAGANPEKEKAAFARSRETANKMGLSGSLKSISSGYEWPSGKTIKDLANAYSSIYEAKKKVDQDEDGDNDFADVRIARMVASGVPKEVAIAKTKNKSYNKEEFELDEAIATGTGKRVMPSAAARSRLAKKARAGKDIGKKGKGFKAVAKKAAERYGSEEAGKRVAAAAMFKAQAHKENYEIVASYLLENNFAETINDANAIIENMSENWIESILDEALRDIWSKPGVAAQAQMRSPFANQPTKPLPSVSSPFAKPSSRNDSGKLTTYGAGGGAAAERAGQTRSQVMQQGAKNLENKKRTQPVNQGPDFGR